MYRHVYTMYIHICKFPFMYMTRTGIYINVQTCMYICLFVYTWYIHVHTMYVHVWHFLTCTYMLNTCLYRFSKYCPGGQDSRWRWAECSESRIGIGPPRRRGVTVTSKRRRAKAVSGWVAFMEAKRSCLVPVELPARATVTRIWRLTTADGASGILTTWTGFGKTVQTCI